MARERFSFDDTIEFDKDELKPNNDIHANHTGKFTFDDEVKEKKVAKPKKKKRKLKIWHVVLTLFVVAVVAFFLYIFVFCTAPERRTETGSVTIFYFEVFI